jgi:hypothetical protein
MVMSVIQNVRTGNVGIEEMGAKLGEGMLANDFRLTYFHLTKRCSTGSLIFARHKFSRVQFLVNRTKPEPSFQHLKRLHVCYALLLI